MEKIQNLKGKKMSKQNVKTMAKNLYENLHNAITSKPGVNTSSEHEKLEAEIDEKILQLFKKKSTLSKEYETAGLENLGKGDDTKVLEIEKNIKSNEREIAFLKNAKTKVIENRKAAETTERHSRIKKIDAHVERLIEQKASTRKQAIEAAAKSDALLYLATGRSKISTTKSFAMTREERAIHREIFNKEVDGKMPLETQIQGLKNERKEIFKAIDAAQKMTTAIQDSSSEPLPIGWFQWIKNNPQKVGQAPSR